jgi:hypothetical protein
VDVWQLMASVFEKRTLAATHAGVFNLVFLVFAQLEATQLKSQSQSRHSEPRAKTQVVIPWMPRHEQQLKSLIMSP